MKYALLGNPNCGKTTLFNELTGSSLTVGNWPGVTVEKKDAKIKGDKDSILTDLPGVYSLSPYTLEEKISRSYIETGDVDVIINIVDATNLERNLYLTTEAMGMGKPMIVALNMMDVINKNGDKVDAKALEKRLGIPVVPVSAVTKLGIDELLRRMKTDARVSSFAFPAELEAEVARLDPLSGSRFNTLRLLENDLEGLQYKPEALETANSIRKAIEEKEDDQIESIVTGARYEAIANLCKGAYQKKKVQGETVSDKIDKFVTNKWLGLPIFFCIMWVVYYVSITTVGDWCIGYVETFFGWIGGLVGAGLGAIGVNDILISLVVDGMIGSLGAIFTFVPQLMILFFFLSLLEDSGYMARIAFVLDRVFRKFGLSGKSFIPMLIGTGCSIPGIMASRKIENTRDRDMTVILTPFVPCGAKLPIFAMFIAMVFGGAGWVGPTIYLIGIAGVIIFGLLLKRTKYFAGEAAPFVMELPDYKMPRLKGVAIHMWDRGKSFIRKAGSIIFLACTAIWILQNFTWSFHYVDGAVDESMLAGIGGVLRYIFIPLGFGDSWAISAAACTGFVAKEVIVATFAAIGSVAPIAFSKVTAMSFIVFTIFAAPCFAAIGAMKRELGSSKKTAMAIGFQLAVAYVLGTLTNLIGSLIFRGTSLVEKVVLDYGVMEAAGEGDVAGSGHLVEWFFLALVIIAVIFAIRDKIRGKVVAVD